MLQECPDADQQARDEIADYLARNFGAAKVNVNKGTAKEIDIAARKAASRVWTP